jgi:hypothetical protein
MEAIQGHLQIGVVFYVGLQSFLDDERPWPLRFFGNAFQLIREGFGKSNRYGRSHGAPPDAVVLQSMYASIQNVNQDPFSFNKVSYYTY